MTRLPSHRFRPISPEWLLDANVARTRLFPRGKAALSAIAALALAGSILAAGAVPAQASTPWVELPKMSSTDHVAVDSPLHRVFMLGDSDGHPSTRQLSIIDSNTNTVVGSPIALSGGDFIADDYQTHKVFITDSKAAKVTVVDGRTGAIVGSSVALSTELASVAVDPFNARVFVMDAHHHLFTLDESGIPIRSMLTIPNSGTTLAVDFWQDTVYVPNDLYGSGIAIVDGQTSTQIGNIPVDKLTGDISVDPFNHTLAVDTQTSLTTIDTRSNAVSYVLPLPTAASRSTTVDILSHMFFFVVVDQVWTLHGTTLNRIAADNFGAMDVDYLSHKVYAAFSNRPWVSTFWE